MAHSESDELLVSIRSPPLFAQFLSSRNDLADRARVVGREEQAAIGNGDDGARAASIDGNYIFPDHLSVRRHAAAPAVVIRPILVPPFSQNHSAPSAAGVM